MSKANQQNWWNALILMRIPFSIFLMPIFWFALIAKPLELKHLAPLALVFTIYHLLVYPASNGYNSYFDKDKGSIGGLEKPPQPNSQLFILTILFDALAVLMALLLNWLFAAMVLVYILISKAYSWDKIRLKRLPVTSLLVVTLIQGAFTYFSVQQGIFGNVELSFENCILSIVATLFLMGSYPITQVYQHAEDSERGDKTLSILLGVRGTFIFAAICFALATALIIAVFISQENFVSIGIYLLFTGPIAFFLAGWIKKVWLNPFHASFKNTMKMNKISSLSLSAAFIAIILLSHFPTIFAF